MKHPKHYDTDEATSKRMANVKLKRGDAETVLAKELWYRGFRYWLNYRKLPGSPDIAIKKYHIAVFVDGEFWHGENWEVRKARLQKNRAYWIEKIEENIARDRRVDEELREMGWTPVHFWEKQVLRHTDDCLAAVLALLTAHDEG